MDMMQYFSQAKMSGNNTLWILLLVWTVIWDGIALWKSAQRKEVFWFCLMMITNTVGILEIFYIFIFSGSKIDFKKLKEKILNKFSKKNNIVIEPIEENQDNK